MKGRPRAIAPEWPWWSLSPPTHSTHPPSRIPLSLTTYTHTYTRREPSASSKTCLLVNCIILAKWPPAALARALPPANWPRPSIPAAGSVRYPTQRHFDSVALESMPPPRARSRECTGITNIRAAFAFNAPFSAARLEWSFFRRGALFFFVLVFFFFFWMDGHERAEKLRGWVCLIAF